MDQNNQIIIGNGMLAKAFKSQADINKNVRIFASGVSNSHCNDEKQFSRESNLLQETLAAHVDPDAFVYFGTCSVFDPASQTQPYVLHKLRMERMVQKHPSGLVVRLPQVAGPHASPYTLLAVLCESIRSGRIINVWEHATRNIIDVVDVVKIVSSWIATSNQRLNIINVANPNSYSIKTIIEAAESVLGCKARLNMVSAGADYDINIASIEPLIKTLGIDFGKDYLSRTIARYYL